MRALVHGLAITGESTVRALRRHGYEVTATDDTVDAARLERAERLGTTVSRLPDPTGDAEDFDAFVRRFDLIAPSPGVPEEHALIVRAQSLGVPVVSEIELAYLWEQERPGGPRPILAVTGTDGKTTTTELTVAILRAAGRRAEPLGNTDTPLLDALEMDLDVYVVECTSFRLAWTREFRADAAVWLNLAPDHLNWHGSMDTYEAAKARIFSLQGADDVAIGFVDDPVVMAHLAAAPGRHRTFGTTGADYHLAGSTLTGPSGAIAELSVMKRSLPHDVTNALAAAALVLETGLADTGAIAQALASFDAPPHRLEPVGSAGGVDWFNDSKATTPHAAATAIRAFPSVVLIAGGSRKGVDLSPMAADAAGVRAVIAIGEAAPDIRAVFATICPVTDAASMSEAVAFAASAARPGDAVVLSPGCASFDWYTGYPQRGDDFRRLAQRRLAGRPADTEITA